MTEILVVGYGNIGRGVLTSLDRVPDMKLAGIATRRAEAVKEKVGDGINVIPFSDLDPFRHPADVAILCGGSKEDLPSQGPDLIQKYNTVDSFDTHANIPDYWKKMDVLAKESGHVAIVSAGWDPGIFSIARIAFESFLPDGITYTFWGEGVSQGHSDAARKVEGVKDARQYTVPLPEVLEKVRGGEEVDSYPAFMHKRVVYVVSEPGTDEEKIRREIVSMPHYFDPYDTTVIFITPEEMEKDHSNFPHGGHVIRSGITGEGNKEQVEFSCSLESNPEFTGSVLVACARAVAGLRKEGRSGAFTMDQIPPCYFSEHDSSYLREVHL